MKRFLYYLVWLIIISAVLVVGLQYQTRLQEEAEATYHLIPVVQFMSVFPIVIGVFLRLPTFVLQVRAGTPWAVDWLKLVVIALPAGYIALLPILYFATETVLPLATIVMTMESQTLTITAGIIFGYVLLDSLKSGTQPNGKDPADLRYRKE
ncbi:hypothetical protein [Planococcus lenghuensis]|uniref:Uncharacterized protein n=1 Tax=Planococcus lenghuensis TaxID=2213202 RepID=A0A1Q2KYA0_9BACL|nr:hypothetical protein [Planococcus lenghuensis]AQQ53106.1 hypothetical protein B0X71_08360 [Planococcus lenghuensis]